MALWFFLGDYLHFGLSNELFVNQYNTFEILLLLNPYMSTSSNDFFVVVESARREFILTLCWWSILSQCLQCSFNTFTCVNNTTQS